MAAMDEHDEPDDLTDDERVADHRDRARSELDQIAQRAKQALINAGIDIPVFFTIPNSGDSVLTFGTVTDPADEAWDRASKIISSIVGESVGLTRTRCREVMCATTDQMTTGIGSTM